MGVNDIVRGAMLRNRQDGHIYIVFGVADRVELRDLYGSLDTALFISKSTVLQFFDHIPFDASSRYERVLDYPVVRDD